MDQRPIEMRSDVLCYTGVPLEVAMEVTGPIQVVLYAATEAPDTDWTAKLVDVAPTGYARNLCDGILRARYRESRTPERKEQHNGSSLGTDTFELGQPGTGFFYRQFLQEIQVQGTPFRCNGA